MNNLSKAIPLLYLGAFAVAAYFVYRTLTKAADIAGNALETVDTVRENVGAKIGETVFNWFNPADSSPDIYIGVRFPDGITHAISVRDIDANGYFRGNPAVYPWYDGRRYRIKSSGNTHIADLG